MFPKTIKTPVIRIFARHSLINFTHRTIIVLVYETDFTSDSLRELPAFIISPELN